jgi:NAD(P)H-dependent FMN reductase
MRILAISGSLRSTSSNTAVLQAARTLAPPGVEIILYEGLGALPHFNPDLDGDNPPQSVLELRSTVGLADGLLISSPEYAHGVPGSLKNALDWLVSSVEFPGRAIGLLNTSPRATHATAQLAEILTTMSARLVPEASVTLTLPVQTPDGTVFAESPDFRRKLSSALSALARAIRSDQKIE